MGATVMATTIKQALPRRAKNRGQPACPYGLTELLRQTWNTLHSLMLSTTPSNVHHLCQSHSCTSGSSISYSCVSLRVLPSSSSMLIRLVLLLDESTQERTLPLTSIHHHATCLQPLAPSPSSTLKRPTTHLASPHATTSSSMDAACTKCFSASTSTTAHSTCSAPPPAWPSHCPSVSTSCT